MYIDRTVLEIVKKNIFRDVLFFLSFFYKFHFSVSLTSFAFCHVHAFLSPALDLRLSIPRMWIRNYRINNSISNIVVKYNDNRIDNYIKN